MVSKAREKANRYLQWMMRTPVISREHPQEVMLTKAFDQHAAEQREACGQKVFEFLPKAGPEQVAYAFEAKKVCLNAVEKSDE